jgi:aminoglycoside 6'-N-acetyltransferase I
MTALTIRRAASSDVESIVNLRLRAQEHFERSNLLIWRMTEDGKKLLKQKVANDLADSNIRILLAEVDKDVIGYVQGEVTRRSEYLPGTVGQVSLIYVKERFRRKGIGRRLLKEVCKFFEAENAEHLTIRYILGNREAERFWRKFGFEPMITTSGTYPKELDFKLGSESQ